ncbi:MAG: PilZ domain-containing protein [Candidatus Omnitrophota bacterium]|nr:PilZ domain-containing protein [Candidatus Omnitrophota bacterium]
MKSGERRDFSRIDLGGDVRIKSVNGAPRLIKGILRNLSYKGFSLYIKEKIELDSVLDMEIDSRLLDRPLACKGRVAHLKEPVPGHSTFFKVGVSFVEVDQDKVTYMLKRYDFLLAQEDKKRRGGKPIDFMPY